MSTLQTSAVRSLRLQYLSLLFRLRPSSLLGSLLCISIHLHARETASRYAKLDQLTERSAWVWSVSQKAKQTVIRQMLPLIEGGEREISLLPLLVGYSCAAQKMTEFIMKNMFDH